MRAGRRHLIGWIAGVCAGLAVSSDGLVISPYFVDSAGESWSDERRGVVNQAISDWESLIGDNYTIRITFDFTSVTSGYLAQWSGSGSYYNGDDFMPWYTNGAAGVSHTIHFNSYYFDTGRPAYSWFDPTPEEASDLTSSHYDLLTVTRHEIGHALGYAGSFYRTQIGTTNATEVWTERITIDGDVATFDAGGGYFYTMAATNNLGHVINAGNTEGDLMNPALSNGKRIAISEVNTNMLSAAYGYTIIPEPMAVSLIAISGLGMMVCRRLFGSN
jgi:hypothetical protein